MVGKTVAEWNENIRQVAQGMGPVTGTMLLVINDTMTTEAKQWVIDYVGRRDTENITKNR